MHFCLSAKNVYWYKLHFCKVLQNEKFGETSEPSKRIKTMNLCSVNLRELVEIVLLPSSIPVQIAARV